MGKAKRKTHLCRMNALKRRKTNRHLMAKQLAFSLIITGSHPMQTLNLLSWNDFERDFTINELYNELRMICDVIKREAEHSMNRAFQNILPGTFISFDGSWEHRRNSKRCLTCVIDQNTQKVVMARIIGSKSDVDKNEYCRFAQNMECKAMELMIPVLRENRNIIGYVHDNDAKTRNLIRQMDWQIIEKIDPGHLLKSFDRKVINFNKKYNNVLNEIQKGLRKYLKSLLYLSNASSNEKIGYWHSALHHFYGNHEFCPFAHKETKIWALSNCPESIQLLKKFLESTEFILECADPLYSTQINEAFHRIKLRYASEDVKWGFTWEARMCCAILDKNESHWKQKLYNFLRLPELSVANRLFLENEEYLRIARRNQYHSQEYLESKRMERKNMKKQNQIEGPILYRPNPYM